MRDDFPRMIVVTFQHPNPYYDDSYAVNSVNVGPYGDAIMQELIPEIEKRFRAVRRAVGTLPLGRIDRRLGSAGAADLPSRLLRRHVGVLSRPGRLHRLRRRRPLPRRQRVLQAVPSGGASSSPNSATRRTACSSRVQQKNQFELVSGTQGPVRTADGYLGRRLRSRGKDGYVEQVFDKRTGVINRSVAQYWKEHYDLRYHLERNWTRLGPKIAGKLHIYTGDMDTYYLNNAVRKLQAWMRTTRDPYDPGYFVIGDGRPHCFSGHDSTAERLRQMADYMERARTRQASVDKPQALEIRR